MLNTTSNTAAQSVKFNDIFTESANTINIASKGRIFGEDNFAKGWSDVYVNTSSLSEGYVEAGMRYITRPSILVSTKNARMAFVLASEKEPVYFIDENTPLADGAYLLSYSILPVISPEYIYYMCKYGMWEKIINNIKDGLPYEDDLLELYTNDDQLSWARVGKKTLAIGGFKDPSQLGSVETLVDVTVKLLKGGIKDFSLPSISKQKELVAAAKEQEMVVEQNLYDVTELVNRYMMFTRLGNMFSMAGIGLLVEAYRIAAGNWVKKEVIDILNQYEFKKDILTQDELHFLSMHLNDLFALVVRSNGVPIHTSEGFVQPQEVTDFMCKMAAFPENVTVYNPFAGANSYAIALPNNVVGEELNPTTWALGQIRLFANFAEKRADITLGDSFESMQSKQRYDAIITSPAFFMEKGHRIEDVVNMLYSKLNDGGKLVCIVTAGFLFSKSGTARSFKERLIQEKAIASVVTLPSNIFAGTGINQAVIVLTKGVENSEILFADASEYTRFAKSVYRATTLDVEQFIKDLEEEVVDYLERGREIDDTTVGAPIDYSELRDTDLTPSLYLTPRPSIGILLSNIAEEQKAIRGKNVPYDCFVTASAIPANLHRKPYQPTSVPDTSKSSTARNVVAVAGPSVIVAMVSGKIRTVYTEEYTGNIAFPSGFIKILKPTSGVSAKYLAALMSTKLVDDQLKAQVSGTVIPRLNRLNLDQIFVPVHSAPEEREKFISEVLSSEMSELEREKDDEWNQQKREVQSTRHAMIQTLSSLSSKWERLKRFASAQGGIIHFSDMIGRINPTTVEEFMGGIEYAIDTLRRQVESFRLEKKDWGEPEEINPYEFIESYKANHPSTEYAMQNLGSDNKADVPYFSGENDEEHTAHTDALFTFKAPRALVERIFDNIVSNAKSHGFTSDIVNPTIQFDWQTNGGKIEITIKNNGIPLKEGVTGADVLMSDFSTALKQKANDGSLHFGIGGFEIKSLMEDIGSVEVISQPDAEYPVIYKLTFNDVSFQEVNLSDD